MTFFVIKSTQKHDEQNTGMVGNLVLFWRNWQAQKTNTCGIKYSIQTIILPHSTTEDEISHHLSELDAMHQDANGWGQASLTPSRVHCFLRVDWVTLKPAKPDQGPPWISASPIYVDQVSTNASVINRRICG